MDICANCKKEKSREEHRDKIVALDSLTIHGLPRVISGPSRVVKLVWLLLFLGSLYIFYLAMKDNVAKYYRETTSVRSEWSYKKEMRFPAITICNMHRPGEVVNSSSTKSSHHSEASAVLEKALFSNVSRAPGPNFDDFSFGIGLLVKKSTHFCMFGSIREPCDISLWSSTPLSPGCLLFNTDNRLIQTAAGEDNGLQLMVYINTSHGTLTDQYRHVPLYMAIHESDVYPNFWESKIAVELGYNSRVELKEVREKKTINCEDSKGYPEGYPFPGKYDESICHVSCKLGQFYRKCGDVPAEFRRFFSYYTLPKLEESTDTNITECFKSMEVNYTDCDCHKQCNSVSYSMSTVSSTWLSNAKLDLIRDEIASIYGMNVTHNDIRSNVTLVSFYFNAMKYRTNTESLSYSLPNFVSDFGGMMGLCVGASVFSLLELVFVAILWVLENLRYMFVVIKKKICC